jgi:hypothetical protein
MAIDEHVYMTLRHRDRLGGKTFVLHSFIRTRGGLSSLAVSSCPRHRLAAWRCL